MTSLTSIDDFKQLHWLRHRMVCSHSKMQATLSVKSIVECTACLTSRLTFHPIKGKQLRAKRIIMRNSIDMLGPNPLLAAVSEPSLFLWTIAFKKGTRFIVLKLKPVKLVKSTLIRKLLSCCARACQHRNRISWRRKSSNSIHYPLWNKILVQKLSWIINSSTTSWV